MPIPIFDPEQSGHHEPDTIYDQCVKRFSDSNTREELWQNLVFIAKQSERHGGSGVLHLNCEFTEYLRDPRSTAMLFESDEPVTKELNAFWQRDLQAEFSCDTHILPPPFERGHSLEDTWKEIRDFALEDFSNEGNKGVPATPLNQLSQWQGFTY